MDKKFKLFAINPGSTSTKIAMFENEVELFSANVSHDAETLKEFKEISAQFDYRKDTILAELQKEGLSLEKTDAFIGRGGGLVGLEGGTYTVNDTLLEHARIGLTVKHPATLGSQLAHYFAGVYDSQSFVVNPPDVDEFQEVARVSGFHDVPRESRIHALNQKEMGIRYAKEIGKRYEEINLIIAHIGGGVSVTAHHQGQMIDSNDVVNGDGPMAPTRAGSLPAAAVVKLCYSGKFTEREMYDRITKSGGLVDHLGTSEVIDILERIEGGDTYAKLILDGMIYQIGKNIGAQAAVLHGRVDAIILTGGISHSTYLVETLQEMVSFLGPIKVSAGEFEMDALASGAYRVLTGQEEAKNYTGVPVWNGFER